MNDFVPHNVVLDLVQAGCEVTPFGSRIVCDPPSTTGDFDYFVDPVVCGVYVAVDVLLQSGLNFDSSKYIGMAEFVVLSEGDVDFVVAINNLSAEKHKRATALCKTLNLLNKQDRINLYQEILYGVKTCT